MSDELIDDRISRAADGPSLGIARRGEDVLRRTPSVAQAFEQPQRKTDLRRAVAAGRVDRDCDGVHEPPGGSSECSSAPLIFAARSAATISDLILSVMLFVFLEGAAVSVRHASSIARQISNIFMTMALMSPALREAPRHSQGAPVQHA
jgi:hypothetical protein